MLSASLKPKTCTHCNREFMPARLMQNVCGPVCAGRKVKADKAKERAETKRRKAALMRLPELIALAQKDFNDYIRERDRDKPCICCGQPLSLGNGAGSTGGNFDCGHYRSVGSASHLRFDERNAHGQRKYCNRHRAGRAVDYRIGLIARIGLSEVEALEADNRTHKWTREELIAIRATYKEKRKALEKEKA